MSRSAPAARSALAARFSVASDAARCHRLPLSLCLDADVQPAASPRAERRCAKASSTKCARARHQAGTSARAWSLTPAFVGVQALARSCHVGACERYLRTPAGTQRGGDQVLGRRGDLPPLLPVSRGAWAPLEPISASFSLLSLHSSHVTLPPEHAHRCPPVAFCIHPLMEHAFARPWQVLRR